METIALHCRQAIMSWMCKDAHAVIFAQNHNNSRLFRTRLCASIWISTRVSARSGSLCLSGLLFCVEESLKAVCAFGQRCATEPWKETKFDGRLGAQSLPWLALPEKFRRPMNFRRKTLVHRAIEARLFEHFAMRMIGRKRNVNF